MFKRNKGYFLLIMLVLTGLAGRIHSDSLTGKERRFLTDHLKESRDQFLASFRGLNEEQLNFRAAAGKWSVKDCIMHLALTEQGLWTMTENVLKQPANPEKRTEIKVTDEELIKMVSSRDQKATAPETMDPTKAAKWATAKDAVNDFKKGRSNLIKYVKTTTEDVRNHVTQFPTGYMDAYQLMLLISAHTLRHTEQIKEVMADPNFPKQ